MEPLEYIREQLEEIKLETGKLPFLDDDIRKDFFGLMYDVLDNYYKGGSFMALTHYIGNGKVLFDKETEGIGNHIRRIIEIAAHPTLFASFRNNINRSVLTNTWSTFEFCITVICNHVLSTDIKNELLDEQYNRILETIKGVPLEDKHLSKLHKQFTKPHLTHISINRKCDKLFKLIEAKYDRDIFADKEFLTFYGKYRNSMHSNYIYYGNPFVYTYQGVRFVFENAMTVRHGQMDITFHLDLALELMRVFRAIVLSLDYEEVIPYPIEGAP